MDHLLFRPEEAAAALSIGRSKVFELLHEGQLESVQIGRSRRITRSELERYVRTLSENNIHRPRRSDAAAGLGEAGDGAA